MTLTLEHAQSLAAAALARAAERGMGVSIAVIDGSFFLKAAMRGDAAGPATLDIAYGKARAALSFGCTSRQIADALADNAQAGSSVLAALPAPIVLLAGGILIQDEAGHAIGALGVAGGAPDDDEWVAQGA